MSEIAIREEYAPAVQLDPTGNRLIAWAAAAGAAHQLATSLVKTTFAPQHFRANAGDATAAILAGDELGLSPIASLRAFYVIHGTPALYAKAMVALVLSRGHQLWTVSSSDEKVVVSGQRKGSEHVETSTWTIARATKAGYTKNAKFSTNGAQMLYAKAAAEVANKIAADVLNGVPCVEDIESSDTTVAAPQRVSRSKPEPDPVVVAAINEVVDDGDAIEEWAAES